MGANATGELGQRYLQEAERCSPVQASFCRWGWNGASLNLVLLVNDKCVCLYCISLPIAQCVSKPTDEDRKPGGIRSLTRSVFVRCRKR